MKKNNKKKLFLKGKKIFLRPFELNDITKEYRYHINNISEEGIATIFPKNYLQLKEYYLNHKKSNNSFFFTVSDLNNNNVGTASISSIDWVNKNATYGRLIFSKFRNLGYGSETLKLIKDYAFNFLNLNSLWTFVLSKNLASIKSNLKLRGKVCGQLKKHIYKNGKYLDVTLIQHKKTNLR